MKKRWWRRDQTRSDGRKWPRLNHWMKRRWWRRDQRRIDGNTFCILCIKKILESDMSLWWFICQKNKKLILTIENITYAETHTCLCNISKCGYSLTIQIKYQRSHMCWKSVNLSYAVNQVPPEFIIMNEKSICHEELVQLLCCPNPSRKIKPRKYLYDHQFGLGKMVKS